MKKLLALFLLIVALSIAAPGILGMQAESRYDAVVAQLQAAGYRVADRTYARGWFSSSARLQLEVPLPEHHAGDRTPPRVMIKTRAVHGPFLGDLERPFGLARLDSEVWLDSAPLIVGDGTAPVRTHVGFFGAARTSVAVPARQVTLEGGGRLETAAVAGAIEFGAGEHLAVGELGMPFASLQADDGVAARIDALKLALDLRRGPGDLPVGTWRLSVGGVSVEAAAQGQAFRLDGFEVSGSSAVRDGAIDVAADYALRSVVAEGKTYGPFDLRLAARGLDVDAIARIQSAGEDAAAAGATVEERSQALGIALLANADALLARDPSLALERLTLDLPDGRVTASFELRSIGLKVAQLRNPEAAMQGVQAKAALRMPEVVLDALLRQQGRQRLAALAEAEGEDEPPPAEEVEEVAEQYAAQQIEALIAQQILVRDAGAVSLAAELRNGLLTVNGKTVPLAALLQRPVPATPAH
jgi:uncharacterized protein YdgA (DUF945 family)